MGRKPGKGAEQTFVLKKAKQKGLESLHSTSDKWIKP